ncbi:MAG TPA: hypothetical protein VKY80_06085 [Croceibacterium sp.]|nr:hypothetical protein [Croceibacterium sp.]
MASHNLALRGSIYWWRRKITVGGHSIALALSMRTGIFHEARLRSSCLAAEVEKLRMVYGQRGSAIDPATLKKIFSDALRWQLDRVLQDQLASGANPASHAAVNLAHAEVYRIFARRDARFTANDDERLAEDGWPLEARRMVADLWEDMRHHTLIPENQIKAYEARFGFQPTASNLERVRRTILAAKEAACREATKKLGAHPSDFATWVDEALADDAPFAFEDELSKSQSDGIAGEAKSAPAPRTSPPGTAPSSEAAQAADGPIVERPKMLLKDAAEACIKAHEDADAWSADTIEQVRAAIRLFDFACGGNVAIDDLEQRHVTAFHELCKRLPNRWGKTKDELERGLPASVEYGEKLAARGEGHRLGFTAKTMDKHITWISVVLDHADDEGAIDGHRPVTPLRFKTKRTQIGEKAQSKKQRARDARSNWSPKEIARLLDAPVWHGCAGLDQRFEEGAEIYHDAWYWLPLMYVLYGGRSSELAGLRLDEVFDKEDIPYFQVDYNDLRALKNVQSIRKLPVHPELIRLGFLEYVAAMRELGHSLLFPEMHSAKSKSFSSTFYKSVFKYWRAWAFPNGTSWRHQARGAMKDKDVHSFRGVVSSLMQGKVQDSVRVDILGHEGENTTKRTYDEEASLAEKLKALHLVSELTATIQMHPLRLRPADRQKFGAKRGAPRRRKLSD